MFVGAFGFVKKGVHRKTGLIRAVKFLKITPELNIKELVNEVDILRSLVPSPTPPDILTYHLQDHPSVLKIIEYYKDEDYFYIVSELCTGGELFDRIMEKKKFNEQETARIMKQLLSAISFCHKNDIVHRYHHSPRFKALPSNPRPSDLKPENILYLNKSLNSPIKIIDFGLSHELCRKQKLTKRIGTPYYIAPEVLRKSYDSKCDIWSCGVIMYILLCGKPPFNGKNNR